MDDKIYQYVYRMILFEIYNGSFNMDNKLPSTAQLCEKYNVGKNSVSKALSELEKNGYIKITNGTTASVIYSAEKLKEEERYRQALINDKQMIVDIFETMKIMLPDIVVGALKRASEQQMQEWLYEIDNFDFNALLDDPILVKKLYNLYLYASNFLDNPVFVDLFDAFLNSIYSPGSATDNESSKKEFKKVLIFIKAQLKMIYECAKRKQYFVIKKIVVSLCAGISTTVSTYIDTITNGLTPTEEVAFMWTKDRKQQSLYLKISATILLEIGTQEYSEGDKLLSISKMCDKYNVSEKTIRKSLKFLNEINAVKTINGIGSIVNINKIDDISTIENESILFGLKDLYYGLELFNMFIPNAMLPILKKANNEEIQELLYSVNKRSILLDTLQSWARSHFNPCLATVCDHLMEYRYLTVFIDTKKLGLEAEVNNRIDQLYKSLKTGKYKDVVYQIDQLQKIYINIIKEFCF